MKKLFSFVLLLVLVLDASATTIKVNSRNFTSEPTQRRRITITLVEAGPVVADPWLIAGDSVSQFTDTNGVSYFSNVLAGSYKLAIAGSPGRLFPISVFDTNAVLDASALVNSTNYSTSFYTATQVDALIAAGVGGSGSATNVYLAPGSARIAVTTNSAGNWSVDVPTGVTNAAYASAVAYAQTVTNQPQILALTAQQTNQAQIQLLTDYPLTNSDTRSVTITNLYWKTNSGQSFFGGTFGFTDDDQSNIGSQGGTNGFGRPKHLYVAQDIYGLNHYGAGGGLTYTASSFNGNLATTVNTLQELADAVDDLALGAGGAASNAVTTIGTNDVNLTTAATNLNFVAGPNISLVGSSNSAGTIKILVSASNVVDSAATPGGDLTGTYASPTVAANAVALGTDTTGNYVATIADSGASEVTVSGSGSETAAVTLALASGITRDTEWDTIAEIETVVARKFATNNGTMTASTLLIGDGARGITTTTTGSGVLTALGNTANAASGFLLYDAELAALGGLTSAADKIPYFTGSGTAGLVTIGTGLSFSSGTLSATAATQYFYTNSAAASSVSNAFNVKIDGNLDVTGTTTFSNLTVTNFVLATNWNAELATNLNGTEIRSGTVADARIASTITRDSEWDTIAEIVTATGANIITNNHSVLVTIGQAAIGDVTFLANVITSGSGDLRLAGEATTDFVNIAGILRASNGIVLPANQYFWPSNVTAARILTSTTAGGITNVGVTGPILGTGAAAAWSDINGLAAATVVTNGSSPSLLTVTADGFDVRTNSWTINGVIYMGTNATYTGGAATIGITGVGGTIGSAERFGSLTIKSTGDIVFTNPASFYASDGVDTRTFTNGNLTTVTVQLIPGFSTNLIYSWSK